MFRMGSPRDAERQRQRLFGKRRAIQRNEE